MKFSLHKILNFFIALIWLANGIYAKLFGLVPRHEQIVAEILKVENPRLFIIIIGVLEITMAIWILSGKYSKSNAIIQAIAILSMNVLEFLYVPDLLLWGKMNFVFACLFVVLILWNEFYNKPKIKLV